MKKIKGLTCIEVITIIAIVFVFLAIFITPFIKKGTEENVTITVSDKAVKRYDDTDKYLIYTDKGTYEITDTIAYARFDSSDLYGKIQVNKTYNCVVCGWRRL